MEQENGIKDARPRRESAGMNRSLAADYVWPIGFGTGNTEFGSSLPITESSSEPPLSAEIYLLPVIPENQSIIVESVKKSDKTEIKSVKSLSQHSSRKSVRSRISKPSSKASQVSLALQKKRLALQVEKERQELERMKHNLEIETEKKQREIENKMKILHMEHELRNAEIDFAEEEKQSDDQSLPRSELEGKIENVHPSVAECVSRTVPNPLPKERESFSESCDFNFVNSVFIESTFQYVRKYSDDGLTDERAIDDEIVLDVDNYVAENGIDGILKITCVYQLSGISTIIIVSRVGKEKNSNPKKLERHEIYG
ncbi:hypothetical protein JTB14_003076 [Gonioctena quinquepunctata]|nr:hypothetical protein JTB14_003076 [Gonioctena quinquepunctata]